MCPSNVRSRLKSDREAPGLKSTVTLAPVPAQALEQVDNDALEECLLAPVGHGAIRAAAAAVRPGTAEAVLAAAWARLRRRPGRQAQLAVWARALLLAHAPHLQASRGDWSPSHLSTTALISSCGATGEWKRGRHVHVVLCVWSSSTSFSSLSSGLRC